MAVAGLLLGGRHAAGPEMLCLLLLTGMLLGTADALYLPGFTPSQWQPNEKVELKVNKLISSKTQLPYSYYTLPYCTPKTIQDSAENLGETLMGDLIENSPYEIKALVNETCKTLCKKALVDKDKQKFRMMIEDAYEVNWIIDNLPAATRYQSVDGQSFTYAEGFFVGLLQQGRYYVHNHATIELKYHSNPEVYEGYRIVGFEIEPRSLTQLTAEAPDAPGGYESSCDVTTPFDLDAHSEIVYTYDVLWIESEVRWVSRWDSYLKITGGKIHWFAIINSLMILVFLSGMMAMILIRTLHRDITKYNELVTEEEKQEDTGWKLVHGDVFRRPAYSTLLSVSVGAGLQVLGMSLVTLIFACLGFLSPARRGALLQSALLLYAFMGSFAGYGAVRFNKIFESGEGISEAITKRSKLTTMMTAFFYPGIFFFIFFILNLFIWGEKSSGAVPFVTLFALVILWFGVSVPLVLIGAGLAVNAEPISLPVRVCPIPRQIPEQVCMQNSIYSSLSGGILPFAAVFAELFFVMSSIWQHRFYYLFGFLALVLVILLVTCAEISIAVTYYQLTSENYNWWWPSFFGSGTSGMYLFIYSVFYYCTRLQIDQFVPSLLYFGYMFLASVVFCLLTGSIGLVGSFFFVKAIYGSIKVD